MTLQELIQHAEETGKAVPASRMADGQMAVVLDWRDDTIGRRTCLRAKGALAVRFVHLDVGGLITVKPSPDGYPCLGGCWSNDQLDEVTVLIIEPQFPFEVEA